MQKTELIQHEPTKAITTFCDRCGNKATGPVGDDGEPLLSHSPPYVCCLCRCDLCLNCSTSDPRDLGLGQCTPKYCHQCWDVGEPYRQRQKKLENEAEKEMLLWTRECLRLREDKDMTEIGKLLDQVIESS